MGGQFFAQVFTGDEALPIAGATVEILNLQTGERTTFSTDESGETVLLTLRTPPAYLSREPDYTGEPYALLEVAVSAPGYEQKQITGVTVFDGVVTRLPVRMEAENTPRGAAFPTQSQITIPPPALLLDETRQPAPPPDDRILREVYIPAYITVHLGPPDRAARNERVSFPDYIKNVASSEIYPTWPEAALRANILAQITFALNRVYTEWYTSRGYDFNITNSTAYDQYYVSGRNIFENISRIVDDLFGSYLRRAGQRSPLFSSYCNGTTVTCEGLSQWGTVPLAQQGYDPLEILRYFYGNDLLTDTAPVRGLTGSYPGLLREGTRGEPVETIQRQLNRIARNYPAIPTLDPDGIFGPQTAKAVRSFQRIFGLVQDGLVGPATWYRISYIYASVRRLAELNGEGETPDGISPYPGYLLRQGMRGGSVRLLQQYLRDIFIRLQLRPTPAIDGIFGPQTRAAVVRFQQYAGLDTDGLVGPLTWDRLVQVWRQG